MTSTVLMPYIIFFISNMEAVSKYACENSTILEWNGSRLLLIISGAESSPSPSRLDPGLLGVWWTWSGLFPHHRAFPLHRDAQLQPRGPTGHQLLVGLFFSFFFWSLEAPFSCSLCGCMNYTICTLGMEHNSMHFDWPNVWLMMIGLIYCGSV